MQIDKSQILELLTSQGQQGKADQAQNELPDKVDTDEHAGLLEKLGLSPMELVTTLAGGGGGEGGGGIGGALGGLLGH